MAEKGFPKTMFHATKPKQKVYSAAQEKALGSEWSETPIQQVDKNEQTFENNY